MLALAAHSSLATAFTIEIEKTISVPTYFGIGVGGFDSLSQAERTASERSLYGAKSLAEHLCITNRKGKVIKSCVSDHSDCIDFEGHAQDGPWQLTKVSCSATHTVYCEIGIDQATFGERHWKGSLSIPTSECESYEQAYKKIVSSNPDYKQVMI